MSDFSGETLAEAIEKKFENRNTSITDNSTVLIILSNEYCLQISNLSVVCEFFWLNQIIRKYKIEYGCSIWVFNVADLCDYSLIGGLAAAVICRWYYRNRSGDLNPILTIIRITLIHQRGRLKKTGKPVKTQTTRCWFFLPPSSQKNEESFKCDTHKVSNSLRDFISQR